MSFFTKLRKIVKYYKQFCITRVVAYRLEEDQLRNSLELWQVLIHSEPQKEATKSAIKDLQSQLQQLMDMKKDGHRIWSKTKWMKSGDRMNKYFFFSIKERLEGLNFITELYDEDDAIVFISMDLGYVCNSFTPSYTLV